MTNLPLVRSRSASSLSTESAGGMQVLEKQPPLPAFSFLGTLGEDHAGFDRLDASAVERLSKLPATAAGSFLGTLDLTLVASLSDEQIKAYSDIPVDGGARTFLDAVAERGGTDVLAGLTPSDIRSLTSLAENYTPPALAELLKYTKNVGVGSATTRIVMNPGQVARTLFKKVLMDEKSKAPSQFQSMADTKEGVEWIDNAFMKTGEENTARSVQYRKSKQTEARITNRLGLVAAFLVIAGTVLSATGIGLAIGAPMIAVGATLCGVIIAQKKAESMSRKELPAMKERVIHDSLVAKFNAYKERADNIGKVLNVRLTKPDGLLNASDLRALECYAAAMRKMADLIIAEKDNQEAPQTNIEGTDDVALRTVKELNAALSAVEELLIAAETHTNVVRTENHILVS